MFQLHHVPFPSLFKATSGHFQTIIGSFGFSTQLPPSKNLIIDLSDGDKLSGISTTPQNWSKEKPTIIMIHGLGGSEDSLYLRRLVPKILELEYRVIRLSLRGCGSGTLLAKKTYHGGASEDLLEAIKVVKHETPESPLVLIGFSLGGNISLKLLGEMKHEAKKYIHHAITVCPATDLHEIAQRLESKQNIFYKRYYLNVLVSQIKKRKELFPDHPEITYRKEMSFVDFDNEYTSKVWDFKNALDYYDQCSSKKYIPDIKVACQVLFSKDDPIIDSGTILEAKWPKHVRLLSAQGGGHMGFLKYVDKTYGFRWMDHQIVNLIKNIF